MKKLLCVFICVCVAVILYFGFGEKIKSSIGLTQSVEESIDWGVFSAQQTQLGSKYKNHFSSLGIDQKKAYNHILTQIYNAQSALPEKIEVPEMSADDLVEVFEAVIYDNPEIICIGRNCKILTQGGLCYFEPEYVMSLATFKEKLLEMREKQQQILSSLDQEMTEFEAELYIHDYIVENCEYDNTYVIESSTTYSCIMDGVAACEGYAKATKYLLEAAGVECYTLVGKAENFEEKIESHMWNVVKIENSYYYLDTTWDDPTNTVGGEISHAYMNLSEKELILDHSNFKKDFLCNSTAANYFEKKDLMFSSFNNADYEKLKAAMAQQALSGKNSIEFRFDNKQAFDKAIKTLVQEGKAYSLAKAINTNNKTRLNEKSISYVEDKKYYVINLIF